MKRRDERKYWNGLRDALVHGYRDPGVDERSGLAACEEPFYRRGFKDGERIIHRLSPDSEGEE